MNIILKPHVLKALVKHVSPKTDNRYYLQSVMVELHPDRTIYVATDGHILVAHHNERGNDVERTMPIIIPADFVRALKVKARKEIACFQVCDNWQTIDSIQLGADLVSLIDATYPNWRHAMPSGKLSGKPAHFDPRLVCKLFDAIGDCEGFRNQLIRDLVPNGAYATRMTIGNTLGVIMPYRDYALSDDEQSYPSWIGGAVTQREPEQVAA